MMVAEIFGMDGIVLVVLVVAVLFGSAWIPRLARSLGSAQSEFRKGQIHGEAAPEDTPAATGRPG